MKLLNFGSICVLLVTFSFSQEHPLQEKGSTAESLNSIDSVNLRNGNGNISLPIGEVFSIGGTLSFNLMLNYNSKIWENISGVFSDEILGNYPTSFPSRKSNAGVGWRLSLGQLLPPLSPLNSTADWVYLDERGGEHRFYKSLHYNLASNGAEYTRDGSYLRLRVDGSEKFIDFPNGHVHQFNHENRLVLMHDALGPDVNKLHIRYQGKKQIIEQWNNEGLVVRTWTIFYEDFVLDDQLYPSRYTDEQRTIGIIDKIELPGMNQGVQVWDFEYLYPTVGLGCEVNPPFDATPLPMLDRLVLPAASAQATSQFFKFSYYDDYESCRHGALKKVKLSKGGTIEWDYKAVRIRRHCEQDGSLMGPFLYGRSNWVKSRKYFDIDGQTLLAAWTYDYRLSAAPALLPGDHPCRFYNGDDLTEATYAPEVLISTETNPLGDKIFRPHVIWPMGFTSEHGYVPRDYGTSILRPGTDPSGPMLTLDSSRPPLSPVDETDPVSDGNPRLLSSVYYKLRDDGSYSLYSAIYARYEASASYSDLGSPFELQFDEFDRNTRLTSNKTIFFNMNRLSPNAHGPTARVLYNERFDGLGNFRVKRQLGYPTSGQDPLDETRMATKNLERNYNAGRDDFELEENGHAPDNFQVPAVGDPWLLGTYNYSEVSSPAGAERREFEFAANGLLLKSRTLVDNDNQPTRSPQDLLKVYGYLDGDLETMSVYGGQFHNIGLGNLNMLEPDPEGFEYQIVYEVEPVSHGIETERLVTAAPGHRERLETSRLLDSHTGKVLEETSTQGVKTIYQYDDLGRVICVATPDQAPLVFDFDDESLPDGPSVTVMKGKTGGQFQQQVFYDGFGRKKRTKTWDAATSFFEVDQEYGSNGLPHRISVPHYPGQTPKWTTFTHYHPTSTPQRVVLPDGSVRTVEIVANEIFKTNKKIAVEKGIRVGKDLEGYGHLPMDAWPDQIEIKSIKWLDFLGRIRRVEQRSQPSTDFGTTTKYRYDASNRLTESETRIDQDHVQKRTFKYNGRGLLEELVYPELEGTKKFEHFDTFGNAHREQILATDGSVIRQLAHRFDPFGRLIEIRDGLNHDLIEERTYSNRNHDDNLSKHQVIQSRRHNLVPKGNGSFENIIVTERYRYEDSNARPTSTTTIVDCRDENGDSGLNGVAVFERKWTFDRFGRADRTWLPTIPFSWLGTDSNREIEHVWQYGNLTGLYSEEGGSREELAGLSLYTARGLPGKVSFFNDVEKLVEFDGSQTGRPAQIRTTGTQNGEDFETGTFQYDESGNIMSVGNDRFWYDQVDRLVTSKVGGLIENFSYDRFGNRLLSHEYPYVTDVMTNRLMGRVALPSTTPVTTIDYDPFGNVIRSGGSHFAYDASDMMKTSVDDGYRTNHVYGPGNVRILKTQTRSGDEIWTLRNGADEVVKEYAGRGDQPLTPLKQYIRLPSSFLVYDIDNDEWQTHIQDHLGNVRHITGSDGTLKASFDYLAYGEPIPHGTNLIEDPLIQFAGHEKDEGDRHYMRRRFHNELHGRFQSVDPAFGHRGNPLTFNKYTYALNNPMRYTDPDGNEPTEFPGWFIYLSENSDDLAPDVAIGGGVTAISLGLWKQLTNTKPVIVGITQHLGKKSLWGAFKGGVAKNMRLVLRTGVSRGAALGGGLVLTTFTWTAAAGGTLVLAYVGTRWADEALRKGTDGKIAIGEYLRSLVAEQLVNNEQGLISVITPFGVFAIGREEVNLLEAGSEEFKKYFEKLEESDKTIDAGAAWQLFVDDKQKEAAEKRRQKKLSQTRGKKP